MTQDIKQVQATQELFSGVMQYFVLPPKRERDAKRLDKWFNEASGVFGFDKEERDGKRDWSDGRERKR